MKIISKGLLSDNMSENKKQLYKVMRCLVLFSAMFLSLSSFSSSYASTLFWQKNGTPNSWYASPIEACEAHYVFYPPNSYLNPEADEVDSSGGGQSTIHRYCFGTIPINGVRSYIGYTRGYPCRGIPEASYAGLGLACIDPSDDNSKKDTGSTCNGAGNPCNASNGNKYQTETDFVFSSFSFVRSYNSQNTVELGLGRGWRHNNQPHLIVSGNSLTQISGGGKGQPWVKVNGLWVGDQDSKIQVIQNSNGFEIRKPQGAKEFYDVSGRLLSKEDSNGHQTTYVYDSVNLRLLESVTGHYGLSVQFAYKSGRLKSVTDPSNNVYRYEYDASGNLVVVIYPDETLNVDSDNPRKTYHYENTQFPNHLTGITDANGDRYATWSYDANGKAISSEHAQTTNTSGQELFELNYQGSN